MKRSRMKRSVHQPEMNREWDFIRKVQAGVTKEADDIQKERRKTVGD